MTRKLFFSAGAALLWGATALAAPQGATDDYVDSQDVIRNVNIEQNLGAQLPMDARFRDHTGREITLGDAITDKPVVFALVYYECPMLCSLVLNDLLRCLRALPIDVSKDFDVVAISIDPGETPELASGKRDTYVEHYRREGTEDGWKFLVGEQESIDAVADAVGFRYEYDAARDEYAHAAAIQIVTPDGVLSRYFYGLEYPSRDVRFALVEAADGEIGNLVDAALLFCYQYDPVTGKYGLVIMNVVRLAGGATVVLLAGFVLTMLFRERKKRATSLALETPA